METTIGIQEQKQRQVINEFKIKLNELLVSNLDKNTKLKVKGYIEDLKFVYHNKQNLMDIVTKLEALNIINIPDDLKKLVSETSESSDYAFWSEFIFETIGFVIDIEKKVNEKELGCLDFVKQIMKRLKKSV
jgi:hypothetical protein